MMVRKLPVPTIVFISLLILFIACGKQKTEWKGTIEEVDGVTVVKNPDNPLYSGDVFNIEEELAVGGADANGEFMFSRIALDVDDKGNLYVLETKDVEIRVFDENGRHIFSFGKKGQGPGEMMRPTSVGFQITPQNEIMLYDPPSQRYIFFSLDGKYLRRISTTTLGTVLNPVTLNSRGEFIAQTVPPPMYDKELKIFDSDFSTLKVITTLKNPPWNQSEIPVLEPSIIYDVSQEDNIIWGSSDKYEISVLNPEGELIKKIIKDYNAVEVSEDYKKRVIELYESRLQRNYISQMKFIFPKYFPAFGSITIENTGRLFIETYEEVKDRTGYHYFDVFNPEGIYIAKIPLKTEHVNTYIWKKSKLYTIEEDEEGFPVVKRYKVTWNLKAGPE
jgi:hypothetical protein